MVRIPANADVNSSPTYRSGSILAIETMNIKNRIIFKEFQKLDDKLTKIENASTKRVLRGFKRDLVDIRDILDKLYNEYEVDGEFDYYRFRRFSDNIMLDEYIAATVSRRYINVERETYNTLKRITETTFSSIKNMKEIPAIEKVFDVEKIINTEMGGIRWTERYGVKRSEAIRNIQDTVKRGLESGDTYTTMSKKLSERIGGEAYQSQRIIRTESHRCTSDARLETFEEINKEYPVKKRWVTMGDERVRGNKLTDTMNHVAMDGVTVSVGEDFVLPDGSAGQGPGLIGNYNDINCRCIMILELGGE